MRFRNIVFTVVLVGFLVSGAPAKEKKSKHTFVYSPELTTRVLTIAATSDNKRLSEVFLWAFTDVSGDGSAYVTCEKKLRFLTKIFRRYKYGKRSCYVVLSKLHKLFSPEDLDAVFAHEIGHVANGDCDPWRWNPWEEEERQILADRFAVDMLKKLGVDPRHVVWSLKKTVEPELTKSTMILPQDLTLYGYGEIGERIKEIEEYIEDHKDDSSVKPNNGK